MTVINQQIQYEYIADGNTLTFPFKCRAINSADIIVNVNGEKVSNYDVTGLDNDGGGDVVFNNAPSQGSVILILRDIEFKRETQYQQNGDFLAKTVNIDFDRIWMALQTVKGWFARALNIPVGGVNYNADNKTIENLAPPTNDQDASTKAYVDGKLQLNQSAVNEATKAKEQACECKRLASDYADDSANAANEAKESSKAAEEYKNEVNQRVEELKDMTQGPPGKDGKEFTGGVVPNATDFTGGLKVNSVNVLAVGDGGLFSESPLLKPGSFLTAGDVIERNQTFSLDGYYADLPTDIPTAYYTAIKGRLDVERSASSITVILSFDDYKFEKKAIANENGWKWGDWRTSLTIDGISAYVGKAILTESYVSSDGTGWYEIWSNGLIKQGGVKTGSFTSANLHMLITPFKTDQYLLINSALCKGDTSISASVGGINKNRNFFKCEASRGNDSNVTYTDLSWIAIGI